MNKKIIIGLFAISMFASQSLFTMEDKKKEQKKHHCCHHHNPAGTNNLQKEYKNLKTQIFDAAGNAYDTATQYVENSMTRATSFWGTTDKIDKTLILGGGVVGYCLFSHFFPRAANICNIAAKSSIIYLAYKSLFAPKPTEKAWWKEIGDDIYGAYSWVKGCFVSEENNMQDNIQTQVEKKD